MLRPATPEDIPLIARLADRIWRAHYTPIIGTAQVEYMLGNLYSEKSLRKQVEDGQQYFLAEHEGEVIGYVSVSENPANELFLHKFYLEVSRQGKGFGKKIFAELLERFPNVETIRLQVNRMNYKSVNFYFRVGFTIENAKNFDIGDGFFMEDYVMVWNKKKKSLGH
jgi:diamine N-acetyltransferase